MASHLRTEAEIAALLRRVSKFAVVGISDKPHRDSHRVASYLQSVGYTVVPVNPGLASVLGTTCYPDLESAARDHPDIDIVDVFRRSEFVPALVNEVIAQSVRAMWLQDGVYDARSVSAAVAAGIDVVADDCVLRRHRQLIA